MFVLLVDKGIQPHKGSRLQVAVLLRVYFHVVLAYIFEEVVGPEDLRDSNKLIRVVLAEEKVLPFEYLFNG
jgi:hypothetical protein